MTHFVYWTATWVSRYFLLPIYASIKVRGLENVPPTGALVIASNHLNDADPGIICTRINRRIVFMAKVELFKVPGLAQFMRAFGAFPVRRNEADIAALRHASEALSQGLAVCIYPEGTRAGPAEKMREGWPGAGLIALRGDTPILPVAITGSGRMALPFLFLHFYRREHITLTIGKPFVLPHPARLNAEAARAGTQTIMEHIAALLPEDHRGYYGSAPAADNVDDKAPEAGE